MKINQDYIAVHQSTISHIERGIHEAITSAPTCFTCIVVDASLPENLGVTTSEYDEEFFDEELASYMEAQARVRGIGLYALLAVHRVIEDPEATLYPIDRMTDLSTIYLDDDIVTELTHTEINSGSQVAISYQIQRTIGGVVNRFVVTKIDGEYVQVKDDALFSDDPELQRVFQLLLPGIDVATHAVLVNVLCGRLANVEEAASKILYPYIGTSQEEEATRVLDIVVDRALAAQSTNYINRSIDSGLPSAEKLNEWEKILSDSD